MISDNEKVVLERTSRGEWAEFVRTKSDPRPEISAGFLRSLLFGLSINVDGVERQGEILPRGVRVKGAKITGHLDLSDGRQIPGLSLEHCEFAGDIYLYDATIAHLSLKHSHINGVRLKGIIINSTLDFAGVKPQEGQPDAPAWINAHGCHIKGGVRGDGAQLRSRSDRDAASKPLFKGMEYYALRLSDSEIEGSLRLRPYRTGPSFVAHGGINISAAHIRGDIIATRATLVEAEGHALTAQASRIGGVTFLDRLNATGTVSFVDAHIGGKLSLLGAHLKPGLKEPDAGTLNLSHAVIEGDVLMKDAEANDMDVKSAFCAEGRVIMGGTKIHGSLNCSGAKFNKTPEHQVPLLKKAHASGKAFMADGAEIGGRTSFAATQVTGRISFLGANINGKFLCSEAVIRNFSSPLLRPALDLTGAVIGGGVDLKEAFCEGGVSLVNCKVKGDVNCESAELVAPETQWDTHSLIATNIDVQGDVVLKQVKVIGSVSFSQANIAGKLDWQKMMFPEKLRSRRFPINFERTYNSMKKEAELVFAYAKIGTELHAYELIAEIKLTIDMSAASVHTLDDKIIDFDEPLITKVPVTGYLSDGWGATRTQNKTIVPLLKLDGFTYERIKNFNPRSGVVGSPPTETLRSRRHWLKREYESLKGRKASDQKKSLWHWIARPFAEPYWSFEPQPYLHLSKVLRQQGYTKEARYIAFCEANVRRNHLSIFRRLLFGYPFGYGFSWKRALWTSFTVFILGAVMVTQARLEGVLVLTPNLVQAYDDELQYKASIATAPTSGRTAAVLLGRYQFLPNPQWPCDPHEIQPMIYSLDLMLPVIPLHQADRCEIATARGDSRSLNLIFFHITYLWFWHFAWAFFSVIGKVVTSMTLITISGLIKPREE